MSGMLRDIGRLILIGAALLAAAPMSAQNVDLSAFLGGVPSLGDIRLYSIEGGGELLQEVVQVQQVKKAWRVVLRSQETGKPEVLVETLIVPGKMQLLGDLVSEPLSIDVKKPKKIQKFKYKIGKVQRAKIKGYAFTNLTTPVGPALTLVSTEFLGFEPIDTPLGSFSETAQLTVATTLEVTEESTGDLVSASGFVTSWISPVLGPVAMLRSTTSYVNGVVQFDTGIEVLTIEYALIDGVEYF